MSTTPVPLLASSSHISTPVRCNQCKVILDEVRWKQCLGDHDGNTFDLCHRCAEHYTFAQHMNDYHKNDPNREKDKDWSSVLVEIAGKERRERRNAAKKWFYDKIIQNGKIENDYDMSDVMAMLEKHGDNVPDRSKLGSLLVNYHIQACQRKIHILSLDGGGVRGYMSIKVLSQLIEDEYLPDTARIYHKYLEENKEDQAKLNDRNNKPDQKISDEYREKFKEGQDKFTRQFDYFAGTSTGGLIALCLAAGYPLLEIKDVYDHPEKYFIRNRLTTMWTLGVGQLMWAKYNHEKIHAKIEEVIGNIFENFYGNKDVTAKNATLFDLHKLLNHHHEIDNDSIEQMRQDHGNMLEFTYDEPSESVDHWTRRVKRERVLLINAYNTETSSITVFNTSYAEHWPYLVADVLKATMAAPTYFEPWPMQKGEIINGRFRKLGGDESDELFIDGGVFANDPELTTLWAIRMQWKKPVNYRFFSIGTGCYSPKLPRNTWGGLNAWLFNIRENTGLVTDTLMDATRSLTETIMNNLAKFDNIKRMKFNYKLNKSLNLDDLEFPKTFDNEWDISIKQLTNKSKDETKGASKDGSRYGLRYGPDYEALVYFYKTYITDEELTD